MTKLRNLISDFANGPEKCREWTLGNIAKALFWTSPGIALAVYVLMH